MFHPKRGRRCNRTGPPPPHRLGPLQFESRRPQTSRTPSRGRRSRRRRRLASPPLRGVFHPKRGRRTDRTGPQPPHRLCPPQLGSRRSQTSRRPSRGPRLYQCRRFHRPPLRDVFHPKRGRRTNRNCPQPPHRLCPPQVGSTFPHSPRRPSRGPSLYHRRRCTGPPPRDAFHPKRGRRYRSGHQPPHRLCSPQPGSSK